MSDSDIFIRAGQYLYALWTTRQVIMVQNGEVKHINYLTMPALATRAIDKTIIVIITSERGALMACLAMSEGPLSIHSRSMMRTVLSRMKRIYTQRANLFTPGTTRTYVLTYGNTPGRAQQLQQVEYELGPYHFGAVRRHFCIADVYGRDDRITIVNNGVVTAEGMAVLR